MKTVSSSTLWGTIVGLTIVVVIVVVVFRFPDFRLPFTDRQAIAFFDGPCLFALLTASYRKLWKRAGFWALLLGLCGAHAALYLLVLANIAQTLAGLRLIAFFGPIAVVEVFVFALVVARLYNLGPDIPSWMGRKG